MLKGCNFIAPQELIQQLYYKYFILLLNYKEIVDRSAERSETHMLKGCIKNYSIVKPYNKVLIICNVPIALFLHFLSIVVFGLNPQRCPNKS